ncbi:DNA repair protein RecO [Parapedobacter indicus]|uniref:DNA repair protein RecO n=1 Tax=Parapedobacter indicus TaxID=1477437 RepID=A0A1I3K9H7_9SPHI|nr:DNA repair protein RecO [Parapedobacter indicus]PPL01746.1 DNA replication and repair protein RecO [Parapedobacter indicus]SFI68865.1 DNA replication and repair protein RecO [Parapedobacter indicus]
MQHKTRGIVLKTTKYAESSVVVQVFTEKFGLQSYIVNGARKPKAKIGTNVLQPLHLLDMVVYHRENASLQRISDARQLPPLLSIPHDIIKRTVALFLNEVLYKSLRQQSADEPLFDYLFYAISWWDATDKPVPNFHLFFLIKLSRYLGFSPTLPKSGESFFDLKDGIFCHALPAHTWVLQNPQTASFARLLTCSFEELASLQIPSSDRRILLGKILDFYRLHIDHLGEIHSHNILEEVFR